MGKNPKKTVIRIQLDPVSDAPLVIGESQAFTLESSEAAGQKEKIRRFPTTRWTLVGRVISEIGTESTEALEWLYRAYWPPMFNMVLRMGFKFHEAEDLTQGYLVKVIQNGAWSAAPTKQGTFTARQYFFLELSPGATVKDSVTVKNAGQVAQVLDLYPADAFNVESGAGFLADGDIVRVTNAASATAPSNK